MLRQLFTSLSVPLSNSYLISKAVKGEKRIVAPFYHVVSSDNPAHIKHLYYVINPERFISDLEYLLKYFDPLDAKDLLKFLLGELKTSKPPLFLSFDDGFREMITIVAPILKSKGIPATFFVTPAFVDNASMLYRCKQSLIAEMVYDQGNDFKVPESLPSSWHRLSHKPKPFVKRLMKLSYNDTDLIDRIAISLGVDIRQYLSKQKPYLDIDEIKQLAQWGFTIGAHSQTHPNFAEISLNQQIREVEDSIEWIQSNIPNQPKLFAFPFTNFGLSKEFYGHFLNKESNSIDAMFGTAGLKPTNSSKLIHRIPMEVKGLRAERIIKGEFFYYIAKSLLGKHKEYLPL